MAGKTASLSSYARDRPGFARSTPRVPRGLAVPWLLVEILFLVAVAALCVAAGLDAPVIAGVMVVAWLLVVLGEWLLSRAERERHDFLYGPGAPPAPAAPDDRSWFGSNGDDTMLDAPSAERPPARLPPPE